MNHPRNLITLVNFLMFYREVSAFTGCQKSILTMKYVTSCPTDEASWREAAKKLNCDSITQNCALSLGLNTQNYRFQYHCLVNSHRNATVEVCALNRLILGFCAEFDINSAVVQENYAADCKTHNPPCPEFYDSAEAYKYQSCYELVQVHGQERPRTEELAKNPAPPQSSRLVSSSNSLIGSSLMLTLSTIMFFLF